MHIDTILKRCNFGVFLHQIMKLWQGKAYLLQNQMMSGLKRK